MKGLVGAFNQEKVGGLLHDYEPSFGPSFEALVESGVIYSFHLQCEVGGPVVAQVAQCHQTVYSPDKWKDWQNVSFTSHYTAASTDTRIYVAAPSHTAASCRTVLVLQSSSVDVLGEQRRSLGSQQAPDISTS